MGNFRFFLTDSDFDETWLKASLGMLDYRSIIHKPFFQKLWLPVHSQTFSWTWSEILRLWQPGHSQTQMGSENVHGTLIIGHLEIWEIWLYWALGSSDLAERQIGFEKWEMWPLNKPYACTFYKSCCTKDSETYLNLSVSGLRAKIQAFKNSS